MGRQRTLVALAVALASGGCGGSAALGPTDARDVAAETTATPMRMDDVNAAGPLGDGDAGAPIDAAADGSSDAPSDAAADVAPAVDAPLDRKPDVPPGVLGACVLHNASTPIPGASQDNDGSGFRRLMIPGVGDIATLQQRCTLDVYRALLPIYCLTGNTDPVTYEVVTYRADGAVNETACAAGGCGPYSCGAMGACLVRDGNLPAWNAADVGPGYARKMFAREVSFETLRQLCTPEIYGQLAAEYCAMNRTADPPQREIVMYNPDIGLGGNDLSQVWSAASCVTDDCPVIGCPIPL